MSQSERHRIQFPQRWSVQAATLQMETFSSRIWSVLLNGGERAIVKEIKPFDDMADELRGAHYLSWRDGAGAVRLLDLDGSCMLLEHGGDRLLSQDLAAHGDVHATEVIAEVLAQMLSPSDRPLPPELQPLRERFRSLFAKAAANEAGEVADQYREAALLAQRLLDDPWELRPLHGDLHHDNVIHGSRGWPMCFREPSGRSHDGCSTMALHMAASRRPGTRVTQIKRMSSVSCPLRRQWERFVGCYKRSSLRCHCTSIRNNRGMYR